MWHSLTSTSSIDGSSHRSRRCFRIRCGRRRCSSTGCCSAASRGIPNGPRFRLLGDSSSQPGQVYELLRERIDYYIDPSLLWFALVTPLSQNSERLVVAYTVRINGRDTTIASTGGTPDLEFVPGREQFANLVWDPRLTPTDAAFRREIRSVYRVGGSDVRRETVQLRIVTGGSADQEKPAAGDADTYIQQFRVAEPTNPARFDADNRLWPRPNDPNRIVAQGGGAEDVIRDYFLVFPSLQPFARAGLAGPIENPANDTIYTTPGEYLYSSRHPQSFYRLRMSYEAQVGDEVGALALNAVQLRQGSERIVIDGRQLIRGVDYEIDYELGRVTFLQPDVLFPFPRRVRVRYEENPLFASIPTSIFGFTTQFAGERGALNFTAIAQSQRTTFTRPPLGFEPASSLVAGVSGAFTFDASPLGRLVGRSLPFRDSIVGPSTIELQGEFAVSRPRPNSKGQAYLEPFEGAGGITVSLADNAWYYGSQPALGTRLAARVGARTLDLARATTLAWQTNGTDRNGRQRAVHDRADRSTNDYRGHRVLDARNVALAHDVSAVHRRTAGSEHRRISLERRKYAHGTPLAVDPNIAWCVGLRPHRSGDDRVLDPHRHGGRAARDESAARGRSGRHFRELDLVRARNAVGRDRGRQ